MHSPPASHRLRRDIFESGHCGFRQWIYLFIFFSVRFFFFFPAAGKEAWKYRDRRPRGSGWNVTRHLETIRAVWKGFRYFYDCLPRILLQKLLVLFFHSSLLKRKEEKGVRAFSAGRYKRKSSSNCNSSSCFFFFTYAPAPFRFHLSDTVHNYWEKKYINKNNNTCGVLRKNGGKFRHRRRMEGKFRLENIFIELCNRKKLPGRKNWKEPSRHDLGVEELMNSDGQRNPTKNEAGLKSRRHSCLYVAYVYKWYVYIVPYNLHRKPKMKLSLTGGRQQKSPPS